MQCTRYWYRRDQELNLEDGYCPDRQLAKFTHPSVDLLTLQDLAERPCLVLLGESGLGKTTEGLQEFERCKNTETAIWIDLALVSDETSLRRRLAGEAIEEWKIGNSNLMLFLDSLDECLIALPKAARLLTEILDQGPIDRLRLRVASRSPAWPRHFENALRERYGSNLDVLHLAPLRRTDVEAEAQRQGVDEQQFLESVAERDAEPFARHPITLKFLLKLYKEDGTMPNSRQTLYHEGCSRLVGETDLDRFGTQRGLTDKQRLRIATRIAALTLFCGRQTINTGTSYEATPNDLTIDDLLQTDNNAEAALTQQNLLEVLHTGLFKQEAPERIAWTHRSFQEYLAADFINDHDLSEQQLNSLLTNHDGIVPQLSGVAALLATNHPAVFTLVATSAPTTLLTAAQDFTEEQKLALIDHLLTAIEEGRENTTFSSQPYERLQHHLIAEQLQAYITTQKLKLRTRREAMHIVTACNVEALAPHLTAVALDKGEDIRLRSVAAWALAHFGQHIDKAALRPLALTQMAEDVDDGLKGNALRCVWPEHLTTHELFAALAPPKNRNLIGAYEAFLTRDLPKTLKPNDLPTALDWVSKRAPSPAMVGDPIVELENSILEMAAKHGNTPAILDMLVNLLKKWLKNKDTRWNASGKERLLGQIAEDTDIRRTLLSKLVPQTANDKSARDALIWTHDQFLNENDVPWILTQLRNASTHEQRRAWSLLADRLFDPNQPGVREPILKACATTPELAEAIGTAGIRLDSDEERKAREQYTRQQHRIGRTAERDENRAANEEQIEKEIRDALVQLDRGEAADWWILDHWLAMEVNGMPRMYRKTQDAPRWQRLTPTEKDLVIRSAVDYLNSESPDLDSVINRNQVHKPTYAGLHAFQLLLEHAPDLLEGIADDAWHRWAGVSLAWPGPDDKESKPVTLLLYEHVPDQVIATLREVAKKECANDGTPSVLRRLPDEWDDRMAAVILSFAHEAWIGKQALSTIISELLRHQASGAQDLAERIVLRGLSGCSIDQSRAVACGAALLKSAPATGWSALWHTISTDPSLGRRIVEAALSTLEGIALGNLTADHLAEFYLWLEREYPESAQPEHRDGRAHDITTRDHVYQCKHAILKRLESFGTYEARDALQRVIDALPAVEWLPLVLANAERELRRHTWTPPTPDELQTIVQDPRKRLITSVPELMGVLAESLRRLENSLHGETPAVPDLWNDRGNGRNHVWRPTDEPHLSDYLKRHLQRDLVDRGVVANREVEIRRRTGSEAGEATDIHVDVVHDHHRLTVIVEVKGCWHREVRSALQTQLVDRYLRTNSQAGGLFVVGCFCCDSWDAQDYRFGDSRRNHSENELEVALESQAEKASTTQPVQSLVIDCSLR